MKSKFISLACLLCSVATAQIYGDGKNPESLNLKSFFVDTISEEKLHKNAADYGIVSDSKKDQSAQFQTVLDAISKRGGGVLNIPKGEYRFANVEMRSNVHIVVDKDVIFYPAWNERHSVSMLHFDRDELTGKILENASIRCAQDDSQFTVDFEIPSSTTNWRIRFATVGLVKNYLISDFKAIDNYSVYCAVSLSSGKGDLSAFEVDRATDGEVSNCSIFNAHPGYGLIQMHSARRIFCEDLTANGGVTLRLETGAGNARGVFDVHGKNIKNVNGRMAVMMAPHRMKNGSVKIDGVTSIGSTFAVKAGTGFDDEKDEKSPNKNAKKQTHAAAFENGKSIGRFADDCEIINIHAVYGTNSCFKASSIYMYDESMFDQLRYADITHNLSDDKKTNKWMFGPSVAAVSSELDDAYKIRIEGVTTEGFTLNKGGFADISKMEDQKWDILRKWESRALNSTDQKVSKKGDKRQKNKKQKS